MSEASHPQSRHERKAAEMAAGRHEVEAAMGPDLDAMFDRTQQHVQDLGGGWRGVDMSIQYGSRPMELNVVEWSNPDPNVDEQAAIMTIQDGPMRSRMVYQRQGNAAPRLLDANPRGPADLRAAYPPDARSNSDKKVYEWGLIWRSALEYGEPTGEAAPPQGAEGSKPAEPEQAPDDETKRRQVADGMGPALDKVFDNSPKYTRQLDENWRDVMLILPPVEGDKKSQPIMHVLEYKDATGRRASVMSFSSDRKKWDSRVVYRNGSGEDEAPQVLMGDPTVPASLESALPDDARLNSDRNVSFIGGLYLKKLGQGAAGTPGSIHMPS